MLIRPLKSAEEQALVAARMRETLVEVLGAARGEAMYSMAWLSDRVEQHLDRDDAAVLLADAGGDILGHTIVRVEQAPDDTPLGLFSTTFVAPHARRQGVASALLAAGESWMSARSLPRAATWTAHDNHRLIGLYTALGYHIAAHVDEMVRLERALR